MLPFQPKYRLGHPENYLFVLSKKIFTGSKYPKINLFNFEKNFTGGNFISLPIWTTAVVARIFLQNYRIHINIDIDSKNYLCQFSTLKAFVMYESTSVCMINNGDGKLMLGCQPYLRLDIRHEWQYVSAIRISVY